MRTVLNLVEWKVGKRHLRVCWTKIAIIYNLRNIYQTKDIQPVVKILRKILIPKWQTLSRPNLILTRTLSAFPWACCGCLGISSSWMYGADCWPVSESGTENILASDSSSESPRPPWCFSVAGKDSSRLRFGSKYSTCSWIFRKGRIVGVSWRWFSHPRWPKKRPR